jgi:non-heme chloroperoxidase
VCATTLFGNVRAAFTALALSCASLISPNVTAASAPIEHLIEVEPDVRLNVVEWGGGGATLLFIPSWSSTSHIFDDFAPEFTDSHRVLVMDMRGHGKSSRPGHGYTIDRLVLDIKAVLDELDVQQVVLVGLSRSDSLITQFAAKYADRVSGLIYLSGPIDRAYDRAFLEQPGMRETRRERGLIDDEIMALCGITDEPRAFPPGSDDPAANELGVEWRQTDPAPPYSDVEVPALAFWSLVSDREHVHLHACATVQDQDRAQDLRRRYTKTSFPFYEKQAHDIALFEQNMARGTIRVIPNADYNTFLTHPELVKDEMRVFLDSSLD